LFDLFIVSALVVPGRAGNSGAAQTAGVMTASPISKNTHAASVVAEVAIATVDHSDIRGSKPHNRDPSGAASDLERGSSPEPAA
jgi:hypothetical protein